MINNKGNLSHAQIKILYYLENGYKNNEQKNEFKNLLISENKKDRQYFYEHLINTL